MSEMFHDSFDRCNERTDFFDLFYQHFLSASSSIADKFAETDLDRQKRMLKKSLVMIMLARKNDAAAETYLKEIAERHSSRDLNIEPYMYEVWLECLIRSVKQCDPMFSEEVEQAWRDVMSHGIEYMISKY